MVVFCQEGSPTLKLKPFDRGCIIACRRKEEETMKGVIIIALAAVALPGVVRLLLELEKYLAKGARPAKRLITAK